MKKTFQTTARGWVDGSTQTLAAQAFRTAATLVSLPCSGVVRLRNRLFDLGVLRASQPPRPAISVGNLTLGGVGKTPFVGWLAEYFLQNAQTPAFISRGYQAERQRELFARVDAA
ncbi:MAG: tetraacyldisaccharide 4'-kinase, partial [Thermoguttaceae bacterium]|nr:tetraacyldisaccharide 4'-kinase [Thermoguttaceae bacterium]